ncbi:hypothetical protein VPNG_08026 [Cytospora leucostoma]|uniref:F-box domain-containing protein n=1 Tax=Cytospora leucostoma TaxID=1230097 RepID=A0A423WR14_9PEZI|nr:hypothetical protein VPNG_08026 [Cytospora leucostoma]
MENLPAETLNSIIQHFCLHCAQKEENDTYFRCRQGQPQQPEAPSWYSVEYRKPLERTDLAAEVQRVFLHPHLQNSSEFDDIEGFEGVQNLANSLGVKLSRASRPPKSPKTPKTEFQYSPEDMALFSTYSMTACCGMDSRDENIRNHVSTSGSKHRYCLAAELFAILLTRLPNIQRLSFQPNVFYSEAISKKVLLSAGTPALSLLKMLDISTRDCMTFFNLFQEAKGPISLSAASLTTLNLHMCDTFWAKARNAPPPALASLQHLSLTRSRLTAEQLSQLISSCSSGLRSFTFEAAYPYDTKWQFDLEHFHPSDAIACLEAHQETLESLHLDLRARGRNTPFTHDADTDGGRIHPAKGIQNFTALKQLLINSSSICGSSRTPDLKLAADTTRQPLAGFLPPDIITLDIVGHLGPRDSPNLEQGLVDLVKCVRGGQFRGLRRIRCDSGQGLGEEFASLFDEVSVDFSCQEWPLTESTVTDMDVPSAFGHMTSCLDDEFDDMDL